MPLNLKLPRLTPTLLLLVVVAFVILTGNRAFYEQLTNVYPVHEGHAVFIVSVTIFHYCLLLLMSVVFCLLIPARVVASLLILVAAAVGYFSDGLNIFFDIGMIRNILETNPDEAADIVSFGLVARLFLLGVIPVALLWSLPMSKSGFLREFRYKLQTVAVAVVVIALCVVAQSDQYASFLREHKLVRKYMNPGFPIYSAGVYLKEHLAGSEQHAFTLLAKRSTRSATDSERELVVLVIGETARADHFSINGYQRLTNPELSRKSRLISYSDISACGTSTSISVPCMFAQRGREDFSLEISGYTENILEFLQRAGVDILWRDNNSDSKGVATRVDYQDFKSRSRNPVCDIECRDPGMLSGLQAYVDEHDGDILIVLHQMGSHGPAYFKRYPAQFERFKPACNSIEFSDCTNDEIVNAYDNTILYTDHFLAEVIDFLEQNTPAYETTMLYVSDHGESLGEGGLYLHGMPYLLSPAAQTHVPLIIWSGVSSDIDHEKSLALKDLPNSHDILFATLLDLFEIQSDLRPVTGQPLVYLKQDDDRLAE